ncbi:restriction endonuclease subunit S [Elizabethkingia miricola]|uniref:restriction endonuclease subunit S n=1 Tax=Elizabethkingia miricola TaxID=172045 RepID=UPI002011F9AC|nr:restriction endonuclease subunit S [Elizabethkingia miricola]MCL1678813.1 restriction endonuclease subunit S [Elizabethkingia miricola]
MSSLIIDWEKKEFKECIIENRKSSLKVSDASNFGDYNFYTSGDSILKHDSSLIDGANIYLATGGIANIKFKDGAAAYSTDTYSLKSKDEVETKYLYFYLLNNLQYINDNFFQGSGLKHLQKKDLKKFSLHIPKDKNEQRKIAEILTKVDEAIENTEALIQKHERIKVGLMQDLLTKGIDEKGNIRSEETHQFKDSPLGRIPMDWKVEELNNNIQLFNSYRKPISSSIRNNMKGNFPYYGATGIIDYINEFKLDGEFVLIGEDGDHYLKWEKQDQTILIEGKFNVSNHAHILKGINNVSSKWIHLFFSRRDITYYLTRQGAGRFKLNKAALLKLPLIIPKPEEQVKILNSIGKIDKIITQQVYLKLKLQNQKQGLMEDLLSGKIRVNYE